MSERVKPWERQRDSDGKLEPNLWYDRFTRFRLMGSSRSLLGCYKLWLTETGRKRQSPPTRAPQVWHDASEKWDWHKRAEAWDEHNRQEDEAKWQERRQELREEEWDTAIKLLEKAKQMLRFPVSEATVEGKNTIVEPADWKFRDIPKLSETASKLARLAAEVETERTSTTIGLDESTRQVLAPFFALAARCITEPDKMDEFKTGMEKIRNGEHLK